MHEIVTLQLGNFSNYVGTHFWNTQESYFTYGDQAESPVDHNVHWRAGIGADGNETFLPRTVLYDLKGAFGSLRKVNALYDAVAPGSSYVDRAVWPGPSAMHKQQPVRPSAYQESLDAGTKPPALTQSAVRYWSDYSRTYLHPQSVMQIYDFELDSTIRPFEKFSMGTELFASLNRDHGIIDGDWRPFVEECELLQGIQIFTTLEDAWGGFASSYLEALRDEYPKSCIWIWGLHNHVPDASRQKQQLRLANTVQTLHWAYSQASMIVPLALQPASLTPDVRLNSSSSWHVSALVAATAETALLPSRARKDMTHGSMSDISSMLNITGARNIALAGVKPFPETDQHDPNSDEGIWFQIETQGKATKQSQQRIFGQMTSYRGPSSDDRGKATLEASERRQVGSPISANYHTSLQFPILDSQPEMFPRAANKTSIPLRTTLRTDSSISRHMKMLRSGVQRLISADERELLASSMADIEDAYRDDWDDEDDEEDDDDL